MSATSQGGRRITVNDVIDAHAARHARPAAGPIVVDIPVTHRFTPEQETWYNGLTPAKRAVVIRELEQASANTCERLRRADDGGRRGAQ